MKPENNAAGFFGLVQAAGEAGIDTREALAQLDCTRKSLCQARFRLRQSGVDVFTAQLGHGGGGRFFARADWRDAFAAAWKARAEENKVRRAAIESRARWQAILADPERHAEEKRSRAARDAERRKAAPPKTKPAAKAQPKPKVRPVLVQAAKAPKPQPPKPAPGPADYSRAQRIVIETPRGRFEPAGPVPSVVDPGQCRPWARAATAGTAQ
jgi:hypothetical protein